MSTLMHQHVDVPDLSQTSAHSFGPPHSGQMHEGSTIGSRSTAYPNSSSEFVSRLIIW
jgi:hypothetical protein